MKTKMKMWGCWWSRGAWVAGQADPTQVVVWTFVSQHLQIALTESCGVESELTIFGFMSWAYDARWAVGLNRALSNRFNQVAYEEYVPTDDCFYGRF